MADVDESAVIDFGTKMLGTYGRMAAARYGSEVDTGEAESQAQMQKNEDRRNEERARQVQANIDKLKDTISNGNYTGTGLDNLQTALGDEESALKDLMRAPKEAIDPADLSQIITLPTSPATKRNAIKSGLDGPDSRFSTELSNRLNNVIPEGEAAKQELLQNSNVIQAILANQSKNMERAGELKSEEILLKQAYAERRAQEAGAFMQRAGVDIGQIDSVVNQAAVRMPQMYLEMDQIQNEINRKANASFFDDPVTWVFNQLTVGEDVARHNQLVKKYNAAEDFVKSAPAAIKTAIDSNAPKFTAMTTAEATNLAQQQMVIAQNNIDKIQEEAAKAGIQTAAGVRAIDRQITGDLLTGETRRIQDEDRQKAAADRETNMKRLEEDSKFRRTEHEERLKMAKDAAERRAEEDRYRAEVRELQRTRDGYVAAALPGMNISSEAQLKALPPKQRAKLEAIVNTYDPNLGYAILGPTPVDVLSTVQGMKKSFVGNDYQQQMVGAIAMLAKRYDDTGQARGQKPEDALAAKNKFISDEIRKWQASPTTIGVPMPDGESWKAFNILPIGEIAIRPTLAANKFAIEANILKSTLPQGTEVTHSMVMMALANKSLQEGNISKVATDISQFYQQALAYNNLALAPERFALPKQTTFHVPLTTGSFGSSKFDLASPKGAHEALIEMQKQARVQSAGESFLRFKDLYKVNQ